MVSIPTKIRLTGSLHRYKGVRTTPVKCWVPATLPLPTLHSLHISKITASGGSQHPPTQIRPCSAEAGGSPHPDQPGVERLQLEGPHQVPCPRQSHADRALQQQDGVGGAEPEGGHRSFVQEHLQAGPGREEPSSRRYSQSSGCCTEAALQARTCGTSGQPWLEGGAHGAAQ